MSMENRAFTDDENKPSPIEDGTQLVVPCPQPQTPASSTAVAPPCESTSNDDTATSAATSGANVASLTIAELPSDPTEPFFYIPLDLPPSYTAVPIPGVSAPSTPPPPYICHGPADGSYPPGGTWIDGDDGYAPAGPPPDYLVLSATTLVCCCWILGFLAVMRSLQVRSALNVGNYDEAVRNSVAAKLWNMAAIIVGGLIWMTVIIIIVTVWFLG